jgi:hypothetical protein
MRHYYPSIIETLINEEALLFAKYLRNEKKEWIPRIGISKKHAFSKQKSNQISFADQREETMPNV